MVAVGPNTFVPSSIHRFPPGTVQHSHDIHPAIIIFNVSELLHALQTSDSSLCLYSLQFSFCSMKIAKGGKQATLSCLPQS